MTDELPLDDPVVAEVLDGANLAVTSDDGDLLDSENLGEDETFNYTFDTPGECNYHCKPHSNMHGLVTVLPAP